MSHVRQWPPSCQPTLDVAVSHVVVVLLEGGLQVGLGADLDVALPAGPALAGQRQLDAGSAALDVHVVCRTRGNADTVIRGIARL